MKVFTTKIEYEVRQSIPDGLMMKVATFNNQRNAQQEARNLHRQDKKVYKVVRVTQECIYKVS